MQLHNHQQDSEDAARGAFRAGARRVLVQGPCGSGKSYLAASAIKKATAKGRPCRFIVHRGIILKQQADTLDKWGVDWGYDWGSRRELDRQVILSTTQTTAKRLGSIDEPGMLLIDEAHHAASATVERIFDHWPKMPVLGFTATPARLDNRPLTMFDTLITGKQPRWLIENNYLSDYRLLSLPSAANGAHLKVNRSGDHAQADVAELMGSGSIYADSIKTYCQYTPGEQCIVFAVNIKHAEDIAAQYRAAGFVAVAIHGNQHDLVISESVSLFRTGHITILVSVDLIGEGVSVDGVVAVSILIKTASLTKWIQNTMRALRFQEGKTAWIFDHGGNLAPYGPHMPPCFPVEWSLEAKAKRAGNREQNKEAAPKCCPVHFAAAWRGNPDKPCDIKIAGGGICGWLPPVQERKIEEVEGDLVEIDLAAKRQAKKEEQWRKMEEQDAAKTVGDLVALGKRRGYKNSGFWAKQIISGRAGKARLKREGNTGVVMLGNDDRGGYA